MENCFVIIGAGQAGAWVAQTLRAEGFEGRILIIGAEAHMPYERPPLSKSVLLDPAAIAATTLLTTEKAEALGVEIWRGTTATRIDRSGKTVHCSDGRSVPYDRLFLTMGSQPRWPDWAPRGARHVHQLRTLDDAARLRDALSNAQTLHIVGGGWIGLEAAASARKLGVSVSIFETADRLCARSLPEAMSIWLAELHIREGVTLSFGACVIGATDSDEGAALHLSDGLSVHADLLLIGIGNVPDTGLAAEAGIAVANGIIVDQSGRTSDPDIFAAGDIASFPCAFAGSMSRRESWANAQNQAIVAAKAALGQQIRYEEIPWLWSDQYDVNIQMLGMPERAASLLLKPGKVDRTGCWLALDEAGIPIGAIAVNAGRDIRAAKKLIQLKAPVSSAEW